MNISITGDTRMVDYGKHRYRIDPDLNVFRRSILKDGKIQWQKFKNPRSEMVLRILEHAGINHVPEAESEAQKRNRYYKTRGRR